MNKVYTTAEKIALIQELRDDFIQLHLSSRGVRHFIEPFGMKGTTTIATDSRYHLGRVLSSGNQRNEIGQPAEEVAKQICRHLGIRHPDLPIWRGLQLRFYCWLIIHHLKGIKT